MTYQCAKQYFCAYHKRVTFGGDVPLFADMTTTRSEILSCSPPMFSSRLLNSLIYTHPAVALALCGPVILTLVVFGMRGR